jgi:hypothetical protein
MAEQPEMLDKRANKAAVRQMKISNYYEADNILAR